jgi:RHS repeat-associated protein
MQDNSGGTGQGGSGGQGGTGVSPVNYAYLYDANGNVGQLVNLADGTLAAQYEYDPYGNALVAEGPMAAANPFRFSTKYLDADTGHYYYGYRYYLRRLGRWANRDPMGEAADMNLYLALHNAAIYMIDALGRQSCCCCCIDNMYLANVNAIGVSGPFGPWGHHFEIWAFFTYRWPRVAETPSAGTLCAFEWWEWSDMLTPFDHLYRRHGQQANKWQEWFHRLKDEDVYEFIPKLLEQPGCAGNSRDTNGRTVRVIDEPSISQGGAAGNVERTLYFAVRFCPTPGCRCRKSDCTVIRAKQVLGMYSTGYGEVRQFEELESFPIQIGDPPPTDTTGG